VRVTPPAARPGGPPIYLGGYAERAVRRAGRLGDGYITDDAGVDEVRTALQIAEDGAREAGRDPESLGLALLHNAFVTEGADAWETVRAGVLHQIGAYTAWDESHDTPDHDSLEPAVADEGELRRWTPVGTPEDVSEALRPLVDAYGDRSEFHLVVRLHYPGMGLETAAHAVELFAREVIPALKGG
jgi:alkanesulfonate monooxygenase SsuD/methylene tetrahydromethanopterin reductase-like flavin-dependent oxidoreductase (luciferase family)